MNTKLEEALDAYWAAGYKEGTRHSTHDSWGGEAQKALSAVVACVKTLVVEEREACVKAIESMEAWGEEGGGIEQMHKETKRGCIRVIRKRSNDRVEGRDAALSRRVPSHDGLCFTGATEKK